MLKFLHCLISISNICPSNPLRDGMFLQPRRRCQASPTKGRAYSAEFFVRQGTSFVKEFSRASAFRRSPRVSTEPRLFSHRLRNGRDPLQGDHQSGLVARPTGGPPPAPPDMPPADRLPRHRRSSPARSRPAVETGPSGAVSHPPDPPGRRPPRS